MSEPSQSVASAFNQAQTPGGADMAKISPAHLLFEIYDNKASGLLAIQTDKVVRRVAFMSGAPVTAVSNLKGETLGPLLQRLGKISEAEANKIMAMTGTPQPTPTAMLASLGRFTPPQIQQLIELAQSERLKLLVGIKEGAATFNAAASVPSGTPIGNFLRAYLDGITAFYDETRVKRFFPQITPQSHVKFDKDQFYAIKDTALTPEERGIATLASTSDTVEAALQQSYLSPHEKQQNIAKLMLVKIIALESAADREAKEIDAKLTPDDRKLKNQLEMLLAKEDKGTSYYELLGVQPNSSKIEIESRCEALAKQFAPSVTARLYPKTQQQRPQLLLELLKQIRDTLANDRQRAEYGEFLASGKQGKFHQQSKTVAVDRAVQEGNALATQNKFLEAYNLFKQALTGAPRDPRLLAWAGWTLYKSNPPGAAREKAQELLNFAAKADPNCVEAQLYLAEIDVENGEHDKAKQHLTLLLRLDPKHARAKELLGMSGGAGERTSIEIGAMFDNLEKLDYYTLLDIKRDAKRDEIQKAYHLKTKQFHPDRFFTQKDATLRDKARALYKRCVEAYMVLKTPGKRKEYDEMLFKASQGQQTVRLKDASEVVQKKERSDIQVKHPQAKKFYTLGMTALQTGNAGAAIMNFQLALNFEPNNELIQKRIQEAQQKAKE